MFTVPPIILYKIDQEVDSIMINQYMLRVPPIILYFDQEVDSTMINLTC